MIGLPPFSLRICASLLALLCVPVAARGFDRNIQQYVHTAWGDKEGAPSGIFALAQTADGYLWIGATDGIYRFDGVSFERLRTKSVFGLFSRPNGDLWIGGNGTVTILSNGNETEYGRTDGVPQGKVTNFAVDAEGTIWASTNVGLARLEGNRWHQVGQDWNFPGKLATGLCLDRHGTFWVATESTIVFLPRGARKFQSTGLSTGEVWQIVEAPNGKLWLAETTRSVRPMPVRGAQGRSEKTEIVVGSIGVLFDQENSLWISTIGSGVRRVSHPEELGSRKYEETDKTIESFSSKDGLTDDLVLAILQDREGDIWVGTNSGLDCFHKGELARVVSPFPLVQPLLLARDAGVMWISSNYRLLATRTMEKPTVTHLDESDLNLYAYRDPNGVGWWSGNGFVSRLQGDRIVRIPPKATKAPFRGFPYITEDHDGVLWGAVAFEGIFYLKGNVWHRLNTPAEIAKLDPYATYTDWMGRVWFGFDAGGSLVTVANGKLEVLAASGKSPIGIRASTIAGRGKHIWVGGQKLVYFDGSNFHEVVPFDGDAFEVWAVKETPDGSLWLAENRGVVHIPSPETSKFLDDYHYRVRYEIYDSADGLPGSFHDATARSREVAGSDGRLWFAATKGVAWLDPSVISKNTLRPPVSIRFVEVDGKQYKPDAGLSLPPHSENLKISYTALSLQVPSRVRFRYRLESIDNDWQDAGTRREAFYTRLRPGKYRFRVIACNNDGVWNEQGVALEFKILPAFYQTNWFLLLIVAALGHLAWLAYQWRIRRVANLLELQFQARLSERTRIAQELHDTLLQGFISASMQLGVADRQLPLDWPAKTIVTDVLQLMRQVIEEGRKAVRGMRLLNADTDDLQRTFSRIPQELGVQQPINFRVLVEGQARPLHPIIRDEVYRIGREAVVNAFRHSQANNIEVELEYADRELRVLVRDDGCGIDPQVLQSGRDGHWGLSGMRERASRIGARLKVWSNAGTGTEVELSVPSRVAFGSGNSHGYLQWFTWLRRQRRRNNAQEPGNEH